MPRKYIGLKVSLSIGIAVLACYLLFSLNAHHSLNNELELARKAGLWTTPEDIATRPAPPAPSNAALLYGPLCRSFDAGVPTTYKPPTPADPTGAIALEADYRRAEPYLIEFERAARTPDCQFQRNWRAWPNVLFPEFSGMKGALKLVCAHAVLMSRQGHPVEALDLIRRFAPMSHHAGSDPVLIGLLVEIAMDAVTFKAIETVLGAHGLEPGVLEMAKQAVAALGPVPDPLPSLRGECAMVETEFKDPAILGSSQLEGWPRVLIHVPAARDVWAADLLKDYRRTYTTIKETAPDMLATLGRLKAQDPQRSDIMQMFGAGSYQWYEAEVRDVANRAAVTALISGLDSWRKSGACPSRLIAPPIDPLTNKPVQFAKIPGGFKVWCVAHDGSDHGGTGYVSGSSGNYNDYDTVYTYPYTPPVPKIVGTGPPR